MMIKTITLFLLVILGVNALIAQSKDFPTSNGHWVYNRNDPTPTINNSYYSLSGDSIINGITYQSINSGFAGFFRTEGKKVYYLPNNLSQEYLSYDFSLVEGDSLLAYLDDLGSSSPEMIYVKKVDSILLNDGYRKTWSFEWTGGDLGGQWIEGIGTRNSLTYPFYNDLALERLLCFNNGDGWIIQDTIFISNVPLTLISCNGVIVSTEEPSILSNQIKISPNPFVYQFDILFPGIPKGTFINIHSLYGQLIQTIPYQDHIILPELSSGTYLLSFELEQTKYTTLIQKL